MDTFRIIQASDQNARHEVVDWLAKGNLVVLPTETVYGLAGIATSKDAVDKIYKAKVRPHINPLIVHYASWETIRSDVDVPSHAEDFLQKMTPGPLTVILPRARSSRVVAEALAGNTSIAVRVPNQSFVQEVLSDLRLPIAMPSANISGKVSPTTIRHAMTSFVGYEDKILMVDAGPTAEGIESTIIDFRTSTPCILRPGAYSWEELSALVPNLCDVEHVILDDNQPLSPGLMSRHYAPDFAIRMNALEIHDGETGLAFDGVPHGSVKDLSDHGNLGEAARNLYATLHELQLRKIKRLAVGPIPNHGIGRAINDRLSRACKPK